MKRILAMVAPMVLLIVSCKGSQESTTSTASASSTTQSSTTSAAAAQTMTTPAATPTTPPPAAAAGALASQETNWSGITAAVTEFRRKGNTLTAKVRFTNGGSDEKDVQVHYAQVNLVDTTGGKKYQTLKDEKDEYIALLNPGWKDRWSSNVKPGESKTVWMKFPAPPAETKTITLQMPNMPPFDDLTIQE